MVELVRTNFATIFSNFENFLSHSSTNRIVPPSDDFQICCFIQWKRLFLPVKTLQSCKPHLNRPTNADAISCWSNPKPIALLGGPAWQTYNYKQKSKNINITLHPVMPTCVVRRSISTKFCTMIEDLRAIIAPPLTFLDPISILAARGHRKFGWKCPYELNFIVLSFIEIKQPHLVVLCRLKTRINQLNFVRIEQGTRPLRAIILVNFRIFKVLGP